MASQVVRVEDCMRRRFMPRGDMCVHSNGVIIKSSDHGIADFSNYRSADIWGAIINHIPQAWNEEPAIRCHQIRSAHDLEMIREHVSTADLLDTIYRAKMWDGTQVYSNDGIVFQHNRQVVESSMLVSMTEENK